MLIPVPSEKNNWKTECIEWEVTAAPENTQHRDPTADMAEAYRIELTAQARKEQE